MLQHVPIIIGVLLETCKHFFKKFAVLTILFFSKIMDKIVYYIYNCRIILVYTKYK
jgi:hypothetical protein